MFGHLYERALTGERCWVRYTDGSVYKLPVHNWLGGRRTDRRFDRAVLDRCDGPTIDLGCGPGRFVADLMRRGVPALGVDLSATAVQLARRSGAPALRRDVFGPLPGAGRWQTVLLADGNIGLGGDPLRILSRARDLMRRDGVCLAEFDSAPGGVRRRWVRLETANTIGPWFRWATVGIDNAVPVAAAAGLAVIGIHPIGDRVLASLALP
ncbi:methyltransferase domain-containing protein [Mycobacterium sp. BMJ-28]